MFKPRLIILFLICIPFQVYSKDDKRNVMLNAESSTAPRELNIGLPETGYGAIVVVDGLKHANGLPHSSYHWSGGNAYEPVGTIDLMEAVIRVGEFGVMVDSRTKLGGDKFEGAFTGTTSTNGLIRFDASLRGPIAKGWSFAAGANINYDPTSVNAPSRLFVEQRHIYQMALTRRGSDDMFTMLYRFSWCGERLENGYGMAPFVYNGDGSISALNGFRLGRDCYMPADEKAMWKDIITGEWKDGDMSKLDNRRLHDASFRYLKKLSDHWDLEAQLHVCYMAPSTNMKVRLAGIDVVSEDRGYSMPDGSAFSGYIQNRQAQISIYR